MTGKKSFKINDFVWAKVIGYPYWPAVVSKPDPKTICKSKKESYWVYFFGSHNYAWINVKFIKPYEEYKKKMLEKCSESILNADRELRAEKSKTRSSSVASVRSRASSISSTKSGKVRSICLDGPSPKRNRRDATNEVFSKISTSNVEITIAPVGILICNLFGEAAARNLIQLGHNVICWSPNRALCKRLVEYSQIKNQYFKVYGSAKSVAGEASMIFSFMSTEEELSSIYTELGLTNPNNNLMSGKAYVEMSQIVKLDNIFEIISNMQKKEARYLAAMIQGTKHELEERNAVLLVGGDVREVMREFSSCFLALAKNSYYIGSFDKTVKLHVAQQTIKAMMLASLTETLAAVNMKTQNLLMFATVFKKLDLHNEYLGQKSAAILKKNYNNIQEDYNTVQTCLRSSLATSTKWCLPLTHTSKTNQLFKNARSLGYDNKDVSSLYLCAEN